MRAGYITYAQRQNWRLGTLSQAPRKRMLNHPKPPKELGCWIFKVLECIYNFGVHGGQNEVGDGIFQEKGKNWVVYNKYPQSVGNCV